VHKEICRKSGRRKRKDVIGRNRNERKNEEKRQDTRMKKGRNKQQYDLTKKYKKPIAHSL
jgi:hypothetical protein